MDRRDRMASEPKWYNSFDKKRMVLILVLDNEEGEQEEHKLPCKMAVCGTCEGLGKHVNPSIDSEGISAWEFDEDPEFEEQYFSGLYDVTCYECKGERVVPELDEASCNPELLKRIHDLWDDQDNDRAERESERRMGC